jgi:hypothetical protein
MRLYNTKQAESPINNYRAFSLKKSRDNIVFRLFVFEKLMAKIGDVRIPILAMATHHYANSISSERNYEKD